MFVLKGFFLGLGIFGIALAIYITAMTRFVLKTAPSGATVGIDFLTMFKHNPWIVVALFACVALGVSIVAMWPARVAS
jgi:hypothetical protein